MEQPTVGKPERQGTARRTGSGDGARAGGRSRAATRQAAPLASTTPGIDAMAGEDRYRLIAEAAYFRAERRGFAPGRELDDWLAAEIEVDEMLGQHEPRV